jgi:hypothetical protein
MGETIRDYLKEKHKDFLMEFIDSSSDSETYKRLVRNFVSGLKDALGITEVTPSNFPRVEKYINTVRRARFNIGIKRSRGGEMNYPQNKKEPKEKPESNNDRGKKERSRRRVNLVDYFLNNQDYDYYFDRLKYPKSVARFIAWRFTKEGGLEDKIPLTGPDSYTFIPGKRVENKILKFFNSKVKKREGEDEEREDYELDLENAEVSEVLS